MVHQKALNELIDRTIDILRGGRAKITVGPFPLGVMVVLTIMDASFAKEENLKSHMSFMNMLTTNKVSEGPAVCDLVEYK